MSLEILCDRCGAPLDEPGGLIFGPPNMVDQYCEKLHVCEPCYRYVREVVLGIVIIDE